MQEKTSSGYDILYPQTIAAQIEDVYSKDETITTATKALYGLGETATPNQVFSAISTALDGKARIQTGSYVGTGTYGASNPCSLTFDWKPNLVLIVASTLEHSYENWAILSMIDVNSTYKNKKVMIPYGIVNYSYDDGINPNFFIKYSASKLYWYYTGNWASSIVCNNANTLYYYIAFP